MSDSELMPRPFAAQQILPNTAVLMELPRTARPHQREMCVLVQCTVCGYIRPLTSHDADRAVHNGSCKRCTSKRNYQITVQRHGRTKFQRAVRNTQLTKPSEPEQILTGALRQLGLIDQTHNKGHHLPLRADWPQRRRHDVFERQRILVGKSSGWWVVDFLIEGRLIVEIDGYWHQRHESRKQHDTQLANIWRGQIMHIDADRLSTRRRHNNTNVDSVIQEILIALGRQELIPSTLD